MIFYNDGLELYAKTSKHTRKFEEIKHNPYVHVLLGYEAQNHLPYVEIEGSVEIVTKQAQIDWLWQKQEQTHFESKDDPNLAVLRVIPEKITLHDKNDKTAPLEIDVSNL